MPEVPGTDEMGDAFLSRSVVLCRTCMRPLTWETRTEPGYLPRTGWYDDARSDPLVCFKAVDFRHVPLTALEWAYYVAGQHDVVAGVRAWCAINEVAAPPLDWAGLGEFLTRFGGDA